MMYISYRLTILRLMKSESAFMMDAHWMTLAVKKITQNNNTYAVLKKCRHFFMTFQKRYRIRSR